MLGFATFASFAAAGAVAATSNVVSVLYAGSLITPMEGPIKAALAQQGTDFQGQPGGSKLLANLIAAGSKNPDVFISVDPKLVLGLGTKVAHATTFATTSLGIGWSDKSKHADVFAQVAAGKVPIVAALSRPEMTIGRTDPRLDPKGVYTIEGMTILAGADEMKRILGDPQNPAQVFPEEDLLARIDTGEIDVGFFYKTEAVSRGLHFVPLPGKASMSDQISYTLARLAGAPHPQQAIEFESFILSGRGRSILQHAGVDYMETPKVLVQGT